MEKMSPLERRSQRIFDFLGLKLRPVRYAKNVMRGSKLVGRVMYDAHRHEFFMEWRTNERLHRVDKAYSTEQLALFWLAVRFANQAIRQLDAMSQLPNEGEE